MKFVLLIVASFLSASAFASEIPSVLPDGSYTVSCVSYDVRKLDSGEILRRHHKSIGISTYKSAGDSVFLQEQETLMEEDGETFTSSTSTLNKYESLGNNQYRHTSKGQMTFISGDEVETQDFSWARVFEVQKNLEINLRVQNPSSAPEKEGFGESFTLRNTSEFYTVVTYSRAGARVEKIELENGAIRPGYEILASGSTCNYLKK